MTLPNTPNSEDPPSKRSGKEKRVLINVLRENWRNEIVIAHTYRRLAELETDAKRKITLVLMAESEERHAQLWADRLAELGETVSEKEIERDVKNQERLARWFGTDAAIRRIEREERGHVVHYTEQTLAVGDEKSAKILEEIIPDEESHANKLAAMVDPKQAPRKILDAMMAGEKWHRHNTGGWLGDVIYGANDGLGAVFGTVSTVAGATHGSKTVLLAGIACTLASALSMGGGAYLATKAEAEVHDAEIGRERREIETNPEHEREELELMYQLKGFTEAESKILADRLTQTPETFLAAMAAEELGLSMRKPPKPLTSALSGTVSTAVGAFVPLIPFFFLTGIPAIVWAGVISLLAHFGIGAAKTLVTGRSWLASGMEMTIVGAIMAVVTYLIGVSIGGHIG